jgi:hypothetical protein
MTVWTDLVADIYVWTNRPDLVNETALALRNAIRTAHRQGVFWRDIVTTSVTLDVAQVQSFSFSDKCPGMRQLVYIKSPEVPSSETANGTEDVYMAEAEPRNLLDLDGYPKTNVYWGIGDVAYIRALNPVATYEIGYTQQPNTNSDTLTEDWLIAEYRDVVILFAASTVLAGIGEKEIKARVDQLLIICLNNLTSDNLEVTGR